MNIGTIHHFFEAYAASWMGGAEALSPYFSVPVTVYVDRTTEIWATEEALATALASASARYAAHGIDGARVVGATGRAVTPVLYQAVIRFALQVDGRDLVSFDTQYLLRQEEARIGIVNVIVLNETEAFAEL